MAIRTQEDLLDKIARDHVWRIREISELKGMVSREGISSIRKRALCRSGIAILYAHWEGFVKLTGTYFLAFAAMQRRKTSELQPNFVALSMKNLPNEIGSSSKVSILVKLIDYVLQNQETRARLSYKNIVNTKSNLSTSVLREIVSCIGVSYSDFESKEKLIDTKLVGRRNTIAHGEELAIDVDDFLEMVDEVTGLLTIFRNLIENSAECCEYVKPEYRPV